MANTENGESKWRYCDLTGKATFVKLDEFILVFLHDKKVNPDGEFLRFNNPLKSYLEANSAMAAAEPAIITKENVKIVGGFDEKWLADTIKKGFKLINEKGEIVTNFDQLEIPEAAQDDPPMDVIRPFDFVQPQSVTEASNS
jgi:hypothetical protein